MKRIPKQEYTAQFKDQAVSMVVNSRRNEAGYFRHIGASVLVGKGIPGG